MNAIRPEQVTDMHCVYCNQELPDVALFCFMCGKPVPEEVRAAVAGGQAAVAQQPAAQQPAAQQPAAQQPAAQQPAAQQQPPAPAQQPAPEPAYQPVTTDAVEGDNVMSFVTISNALNVVEGLARDPEQAKAANVDPEIAEALRAKLQTAFDFLADLHKVNDKMEQAMSLMKRASQVLTSGGSGGGLREDPNSWLCTQNLTAAEAELYNLAGRQAELREGLETRVLRVCESCRYQRIYNPEYEKMVAQQNQLDSLLMLPRNALMALSRLRRAQPKFVCPRCQGMKASERTIVLCPNCGTPNMDLLLTTCGKCGYDFVHRSGGREQPPQAEAEQTEPQAKPSGKVLTGRCADCGNPFRVPVELIPPEGLKGKCSRCGRPLRIRLDTSRK
ncbi:MAG: hypothetical protein J7M38_12425 [Armatimonadetes bacterium]|nr:hypothetical protein [Armatimonadota bacterium]